MNHSINSLFAFVFALTVLPFLQSAPIIAQTDFVRYTGNPILPLGNPGEWDGAAITWACVLKVNSTYHMWYTGDSAVNYVKSQIGYASSDDGLNWSKYENNPVLTLGSPGEFDDRHVWGPHVIYNGSTYEMWYTGDSVGNGSIYTIGYATAPNPTDWTKHPDNPVLTNGGSGDFDAVSVLQPVVIRSDSLYQMWYSGGSGTVSQTGYATSSDGIHWTKYTGNPVLPVGSPGSWDATWVGASSVLYNDGQYHMWYEGDIDGDISDVKIGYATSQDGLNWTKSDKNPIMSPTQSGWESDNVWYPSVLKEGDIYKMWYSGRSNSGADRLGYAEDFIIGIETVEAIQPEDFYLKQNYPNPFNPATTIEFVLQRGGFVTLKVYNVLGEEVATLLETQKPAGQHVVNFDASQLSSGIYYYTLTADDFKQTRKMVLLR